MTAELERNDAGKVQLVITPHSTTEGVAIEDHMHDLGLRWDPDRAVYILKPAKETPTP